MNKIYYVAKVASLLLLLALTNQIIAQTQQSNWYIYQPSNFGKNVTFSQTSSSIGTNFPWPKYQNMNIDNYVSSNSAVDKNGNIVFYVINTVGKLLIYDKTNTLIYSENPWSGKYINEIPIIKRGNCGYYDIVIGDKILVYNQTLNIIDTWNAAYQWYSNSYGESNLTYLNLGSGSIELQGYCYAVRNKSNGEYYNLYTLSGNHKSGGTNGKAINLISRKVNYKTNSVVIESKVELGNVQNPNSNETFSWYLSEMEVSPDGSKLAFADDNTIYVYSLNTDGSIGSKYYEYMYNYQVTMARIGGLEFSADNKYLTFSICNSGTNSKVGIIDFYDNSSVLIYNSGEYVNSQIELGRDGNLYLSSTNYMAKININSNDISTSTITNKLALTNPINIGYIDNDNNFGIRTLPDQIDGFDNSLGYTAIENFNTTSNGVWDKYTNPITNNSPYPNNYNGPVKILKSLVINHDITINGLTFEFADNAKLIITNGAKLTLNGCTLKGLECSQMWNGISIINNEGPNYSQLIMNKDANYNVSEIRDAFIGIKAVGNKVKLDVQYSNFSFNEYDIFASNIRDYLIFNIKNCNFDGGGVLRNQINHGSKYGWNDNLQHSVAAITFENCFNPTNNLNLSGFFVGSDQSFIAASGRSRIGYYQYGVISTNSQVILNGVKIESAKQFCVLAKGSPTQAGNLNISNCHFYRSNAGLDISNRVHTLIQTSTFESIENSFAVNWYNNADMKLTVGKEDDVDFAYANTFKDCKLAAINLYNNTSKLTKFGQQVDNTNKDGTQITIAHNNFTNQPYALSVSAQEAINNGRFSLGKSNYQYTKIIGNKMSTGRGIDITNIYGENIIDKAPKNIKKSYTINTTAINHQVSGNTVYNQPNNTNGTTFYGIRATQGGRMNVWDDSVYTLLNRDWRNSAIIQQDAPGNCVTGNICKGGSGLYGIGNMFNSNYYCNYFNYCETGLKLSRHIIRNINEFHGTPGSGVNNDSRHNYFKGTPDYSYDMWLDLSDAEFSRNKWVYLNNSNVKQPTLSDNSKKKLLRLPATYSDCMPYENQVINEPEEAVTINVDFSEDELTNWRLQYLKEQLYRGEELNEGTENADIVSQLNIEYDLQQNNMQSALTKLTIWQPSNDIGADFKSVYQIYANAVLRDTASIYQLFGDTSIVITERDSVLLTTSEIETLTDIAEKNPSSQSPAAVTARVILYNKLKMEFWDEVTKPRFNISGYAGNNCLDTLFGIEVYLEDFNQNRVNYTVFTDEDGVFVFDGDSLAKLIEDYNQQFRLVAVLQDFNRTTNYHSVNDLIYNSHHYLGCSLEKTGKPIKTAVNEVNGVRYEIYPIPANASIHLVYPANATKLAIYNHLGVRIKELPITSDLNTQGFADGIYFLSMVDGSGKTLYSEKVLIQHD